MTEAGGVPAAAYLLHWAAEEAVIKPPNMRGGNTHCSPRQPELFECAALSDHFSEFSGSS